MAALLTDIRLPGLTIGEPDALNVMPQVQIVIGPGPGCSSPTAETDVVTKPYDAKAIALRIARSVSN